MKSNIAILVVEDNFVVRQNIVDHLNDLGYQDVYTAKNADEAFNVLKEKNISIVFLDIELNGSAMDGIEIGEVINKKHPTTGIIFLTAYTDDDTMNRSHAIRHENYLVKPVSLQQIYASIKRVLTINNEGIFAHDTSLSCPFSNKVEEIFIKLQNDKYFYRVLIKDIIFIKAANKGIEIITDDKSFFLYCSLSDVLKKLDNPSIAQVHKSYVINKGHISSISSSDVVMSNAKVIPIGRNYKGWYSSDSIITLS